MERVLGAGARDRYGRQSASAGVGWRWPARICRRDSDLVRPSSKSVMRTTIVRGRVDRRPALLRRVH